MLAKYPTPQHWRKVRFSDETHFGYDSQGRVWVTRKPGERYCPDCVQQKDLPKEKDTNQVHTWGAIGYNYKSKLYRYDTNTSNGKMTQKVYLELLQAECTSWPSDAVLEEDRDSGHGTSESNPIRTWKEQQCLLHYFNCVRSPDLSPIENAWQAPKAHVRKFASWDDESVWKVSQEGWNKLPQKTINAWIDSMPARLQAVIDGKGQMTAY